MAATRAEDLQVQSGQPPYQLESFWIQVTGLATCSLLVRMLIVYVKEV